MLSEQQIKVIKGMSEVEIMNAIKTLVAKEHNAEEMQNHLINGFYMLSAKLGKLDK